MSCASVLSVSSLSPAVRSPTSPGILASTTRRFAGGCAKQRPMLGPAAIAREVKDLRRANEILRAASVFFAKELDQPRPR